jgi:hypothetical protein
MHNYETKVRQVEKVSEVIKSKSNLTLPNLFSPVKQFCQEDGKRHHHEVPRPGPMYNEESKVRQVEKVSKIENIKVVTIMDHTTSLA